MANWTTLKAAIAGVIKTNGNQEITGTVLQNTLNSIVNAVGENATFAGVATPSTNPGMPDGPVFYLASQIGLYSNFNGLTVEIGEIAIFIYKTSWQKQSLSYEITEVNVSKIFPTGGIDGTNKYTLETAIAMIPASLRSVGIKCSFLDETGMVEEWVYQGGTFTSADSWMQGGSGAGGNMILEWDTDVATTRNSVPTKQRKLGLIICYCHPELGWVNEQYVYKGTSDISSNSVWNNDDYWRKLFSEEQLGELAIGENLIKSLIYGKYIGTDGNEIVNANGICTSSISVEPNTIYSLSNFATRQNNCNQLSYYDSNKAYISGITSKAFHQFKTPSNCSSIRITLKSGTYNRVFDEDIILVKSLYIPFKTVGALTYNSALQNFFAHNNTYLNYPYPNFTFTDQQVLLFPSNKKRVNIISYNKRDLVISQVGYMRLDSDGNYTTVENPAESDFASISINFYSRPIEEVIDFITHLGVVTFDENTFPIVPPLCSIAPIGDEYLTTKEIARYGYGNINTDVAMQALSKDSFEKMSSYTNDSAYSFLQGEDGINKIIYLPGQGWASGMTNPYLRHIGIKWNKYMYSYSWERIGLILAINFSWKFYIDGKSIYDFLIDNFYINCKVIGLDKTISSNIYIGYFNKVTDLEGTEVQQLQVGQRYVLVSYNSNKLYVYYFYVDIVSDNEFKVSGYSNIQLSDKNVPSDRIIGEKVEFEIYTEVYTSTNDFNYTLKCYEPKYSIINLAVPSFADFNITPPNSASNKVLGRLLNYTNTDISSIEQIKTVPFTTVEQDNYWVRNELKGVNVVWLGTSVPNEPPYGGDGTKKYPEFVAKLLNFTLTVRSIGGTKMTYNPSENVFGLSMTEAEYEDHKSAAGVERSYETQLEGCWDSDLFVFDHLHNDNGLLAKLKDNPDYWDNDLQTFKITETNKFDRTWAVGGFNYVIAEIFRYNPRAKIVIINDWRAEPFYNKLANRVVADLWGIPICELRMCNGNVDITTAKDTYLRRYNGGADIKLLAGSSANPLYYQTKSAPDESAFVVEEETSITFEKGSDSIHPGRYGRIMYAKAVARWMLNNVLLDKNMEEFL